MLISQSGNAWSLGTRGFQLVRLILHWILNQRVFFAHKHVHAGYCFSLNTCNYSLHWCLLRYSKVGRCVKHTPFANAEVPCLRCSRGLLWSILPLEDEMELVFSSCRWIIFQSRSQENRWKGIITNHGQMMGFVFHQNQMPNVLIFKITRQFTTQRCLDRNRAFLV